MPRKTFYRIRNWGSKFETAETRKLKGGLRWVAIPTKHDGKTFRRLMRKKNAAQIYGAWVLIVAVAAKCPVRGDLVDEDGPLTAADLEDKTGLGAEVYNAALELLSADDLRWIETVDFADYLPESAGAPAGTASAPAHTSPTGPDRTGPNRTEPDRTGQAAGPGSGNADWKAPDTATLRDTQRLLTWLDTEGRKAGLPDTPEVKTRVVAAAERALEHGNNKPRFFAKLIHDGLQGDWSKLTGEQLDNAKRRLRGTGDTNGFAAQIAAKIGAKRDEDRE